MASVKNFLILSFFLIAFLSSSSDTTTATAATAANVTAHAEPPTPAPSSYKPKNYGQWKFEGRDREFLRPLLSECPDKWNIEGRDYEFWRPLLFKCTDIMLDPRERLLLKHDDFVAPDRIKY